MVDRPEDRDLSLPTRVACAVWGDHRFCGWSVRQDLAGVDGYWSTVSLALGGSRLSSEEAGLLDDLATASLSADPRIWPMKIARLMACYGRFEPALAGPFLAIAGGALGPPAIGAAARWLAALGQELGDHAGDESLLRAAVDRRVEAGQSLPGFGTPYRSEDERLAPIAASVERRGRADGEHWQLMLRLARVVEEQRGLAVNAGAALSAACLDLGFSPQQIDVLAVLLLLPSAVANAHEGALQAPAVLRRLPDRLVRYVGPAARPSPRLEAAESRP